MYAAAAVAVVVGVADAGTTVAAAESAAEVRHLAQRAAAGDTGAVERLQAVREVDGQPVDYRQALSGARGDDLARRLATIAAEPAGAGAAPAVVSGARDEARRILSSRRFEPPSPPRPLRAALRRLGEWLAPILSPLGRLLAPAGRLAMRIWETAWMLGLAGLAVVVAAAWWGRHAIARRNRAGVRKPDRGGDGQRPRPRPGDLEREAEAAEVAGHFDRAFRLRFVAGLLRLDDSGALDYRESLTTAAIVRAVRSPALSTLAVTFDEIAYGGRVAGPDDVAAARATWPRVLVEARS